MPHPITLLALGDSLTEGYGLDPDDALPAALERLLRAGGHDVTVINLGLSGDTTAGGLRRLRAWLVRNPGFGNDEGAAPHCFAMVELGANDGFMGLDPQDMEENLAAILALLAERRVPPCWPGSRPNSPTIRTMPKNTTPCSHAWPRASACPCGPMCWKASGAWPT